MGGSETETSTLDVAADCVAQIDNARLHVVRRCGRLARDGDAFVIRHFATDVLYSAAGFVARNADVQDADLLLALQSSRMPQLLEMLAPQPGGRRLSGEIHVNGGGSEGGGGGVGGGAGSVAQTTVAQRYTSQLAQLLSLLRAARVRFVHCICVEEI